MGLCTSKVKPTVPLLQCPEGCDPQKFRQILRLFDRLDGNGDLGVCLEELSDIAELHVQNRIQKLGEQKEHEQNQKTFAMQHLVNDEAARIEDVKEDVLAKCRVVEREYSRAVACLEAEMARLRKLNDTGKSAEFQTVLQSKKGGGGGDTIDFWTFFDYMRTRTDDIKRIQHHDE